MAKRYPVTHLPISLDLTLKLKLVVISHGLTIPQVRDRLQIYPIELAALKLPDHQLGQVRA